ncbi:hypothetical protein RCC89_14440 [Cytophagaceae bacterium ABcell3]|nr:hypothetical protein RCC89_14440 [Cytophagaceae bacterium ABcell3]
MSEAEFSGLENEQNCLLSEAEFSELGNEQNFLLSEAEFSKLENEQNLSGAKRVGRMLLKPKGIYKLLLFNSGNSNILEILIQTDNVRSRILEIKE